MVRERRTREVQLRLNLADHEAVGMSREEQADDCHSGGVTECRKQAGHFVRCFHISSIVEIWAGCQEKSLNRGIFLPLCRRRHVE